MEKKWVVRMVKGRLGVGVLARSWSPHELWGWRKVVWRWMVRIPIGLGRVRLERGNVVRTGCLGHKIEGASHAGCGGN